MPEKIDIAVREGGEFVRMEVEVCFRDGNWAVHRAPDGADYAVSHVPTGQRLIWCRTLRAAKWACSETEKTMHPKFNEVPFGGDVSEFLTRDERKACGQARSAIVLGARKLDEPKRKR